LNNSLEEVEEGSNEEEMLVIRRALSSLASQADHEKKGPTFYTRCTIGRRFVLLL